MVEVSNAKTAAIVCEHISSMKFPILSAFRTEPDSPEDSGWQFFCGQENEENPDDAKVWLLEEVLKLEPTLAEYMDLPIGYQLWRENVESEWQQRMFE